MATYKAVIRSGDQYLKADKTTNIKIRITHHGKQAYIPTNFYVLPGKQWNAGEGLAKGFSNAKFINERLTQMLSDLRRKDIELGDLCEVMTVTDIRDSLMVEKRKTVDFFAFAAEVIARLKASEKIKTAEWHEAMIGNLKKFVDQPVLDIIYITSDFLSRFENYLFTKEKPLTSGGVNNYMRSFRSLFNQARDHFNDENSGKIAVPNYPFRKYKIPTVKRRMQGKSLSVDEMKLIVAMVPATKYHEWAKDMFLLMFFLIGINAKDLYYLQKPTGKRIEYDRFKTGRSYSVKLEPEAARIAKKYQHAERFLNLCENYATYRNFTKQIDKHLKKVANSCKIEKQIASNFARHTWGTIARNECRILKNEKRVRKKKTIDFF